MKGIKIALLVQELRRFCWIGGLCLLVELHREGSAPAACAAGLFWFTTHWKNITAIGTILSKSTLPQTWTLHKLGCLCLQFFESMQISLFLHICTCTCGEWDYTIPWTCNSHTCCIYILWHLPLPLLFL